MVVNLVHITRFWGRELRAQDLPRFSQQTPPCLRGRHCFEVQLGMGFDPFEGCCERRPSKESFDPRVFRLTEYHFLDYHPDNWELYYLNVSTYQKKCFFNFALLPQNEELIVNLKQCQEWTGWQFVGICHAQILRMDMEEVISPIIHEAFAHQAQDYHCHVQVFMDRILDRESPPLYKDRRRGSSEVLTETTNRGR